MQHKFDVYLIVFPSFFGVDVHFFFFLCFFLFLIHLKKYNLDIYILFTSLLISFHIKNR